MKALIHVGLSKTGTTTIQNFLQANAATLRQRGIYYRRYFGRSSQPEFTLAIETRLGQPVGNVNLRAAMRLSGNFPRQQRLAAAFERRLAADLAASGCDRFIGSSEYLAHMGRTPAYIAALDAWMRERFAEIRYVVYLRRQDDWLISTYSQHIRGGGTLSLDEFLAWRKPPNFERLVTRWEGVLGAERLDVRLFDRASFVDGDLLADFCAAAGLDPAGLASAASLNERLGPRQARLIRACNAAIGRAVAAETPNFMLRRAAGGLVALVPPGTARLALAPGVRERIMAACARSNERLRRRRFPGRAVLFP